MKKNSMAVTLIILTVILAIVAAARHLITVPEAHAGTLQVSYSGNETTLALADITINQVTGEILNGKGETLKIDAQGALLADVLIDAGIPVDSIGEVTVTALDEYSAVVTGEEVRAAAQVCLIYAEDGMQLIVFGDPDSRRNVRNVVRMDVK